MAAHWGLEPTVYEFKDLQALTMGVDCLGRWALLAGRRVLAGVELGQKNLVRVQKKKQWDISRVQWNPHASHAGLFVLACNQKLEVHRFNATSQLTSLNQFSGHSRNISDVDWSPFDVNIIASCSTDAYVHLWDIRDPKKPSVSFENHAGASQVKWNQVRSNLLATTHETEVRLWDPRKRNMPIGSINAHLKQINCLDWCPHNENKFITTSIDNTIKFWDVETLSNNSDEGSILTSTPVWQARYTPFGYGVVAGLMAKLGHGDGNIYLYSADQDRHHGHVHTFTGHSDIVLDMQWLKKEEGSRDYCLVSWGRDQTLRMWQVDPGIQRLCDASLEGILEDDEELVGRPTLSMVPSSSSSTITSVSTQRDGQARPQSLGQEFSLCNLSIPHLAIEELDPSSRLCKVTTDLPHHQVHLTLSFPPNYPYNAPPDFQLTHCSLDSTAQKRLIKVLTDTSQKHVKRNMNCLEPCLRQLSNFTENFTQEERRTPDLEAPYLLKQQPALQPASLSGLYSFRGFKDDSIPFPRTSGARFSPGGHLTVFGVPSDMRKASGRVETPKAMVELVAYAQPAWKAASRSAPFSSLYSRSPPTPSSEPITISNFFTSAQQQRTRTKSRSRHRDFPTERSRKGLTVGVVKIYDAAGLLTISRELAMAYSMDTSDMPAMCHHNAAVAEAYGRKDLVQSWQILGTLTDKSLSTTTLSSGSRPWARRPFGRPLLTQMMDYYKKIYDIQMLALICILFWDRKEAEKQSSTPVKPAVDHTPVLDDQDLLEDGDQMEVGTPGSLQASSPDSGWSMLLRTLLPSTSRPPLPGVTSHPNLATLFYPGVKNRRSNSWSDSYNEYQIVDEMENAQTAAEKRELLQHQENCRLLDPRGHAQFEEFKRIYASILFAWGLLNQAATMRNYVATPIFTYQSKAFKTYCQSCREETSDVQCERCRAPSMQCSICHVEVRGAANICLACGHGGHARHLQEWFLSEVICPTGCGCHCLDESVLTRPA